MPFLSELDVRRRGSRKWELLAPVVYQGAQDRFEIPAGFVTDLASVPRPLWVLFPKNGKYTMSAVLHDYLYAEQPMCMIYPAELFNGERAPISRADADGLFLRCMREQGVRWIQRWPMYAAVRMFGGFVWRKARKKNGSS